MKNNEQNNFETTAANAEEKLGRVSGAMDDSLSKIPAEKLEAAKKEIVQEKVGVFLSVLGNNIEMWKEMEDRNAIYKDMKDAFNSSTKGFVPELSEAFVKSTLNDEKLLKYCKISDMDANISLFVFLSLLGERYENRETERKKKTGDTDPIIPLVLHFTEGDFSEPPRHFGAYLSKYLSLIIEGDAGSFLGCNMQSGIITVLGEATDDSGHHMTGGIIHVQGNLGGWTGNTMKNGEIEVLKNAGNCTGVRMQGGKLTINGDVGNYAAYKMLGGTLDIRGNVLSFDDTAFKRENKGTILWKNKTIWRGGAWTPEGRTTNERGEIPIDK